MDPTKQLIHKFFLPWYGILIANIALCCSGMAEWKPATETELAVACLFETHFVQHNQTSVSRWIFPDLTRSLISTTPTGPFLCPSQA
jgi:hypothetical protein